MGPPHPNMPMIQIPQTQPVPHDFSQTNLPARQSCGARVAQPHTAVQNMVVGSSICTAKNAARMQMIMFKDGDQKLSSSYNFFGGVFRDGQRIVLSKKIRLSCVVWMDPEIWTPIRVAGLTEDQVDMLLYCLCGVKIEMRCADLQVNTKHELREMLFS